MKKIDIDWTYDWEEEMDLTEIKFIYFEIYWINGVGSTNPVMQNENALMLKPHTNSRGVWCYRNLTERKGFSEPTYSTVDQWWIDLDKCEYDYSRFDDDDGTKEIDDYFGMDGRYSFLIMKCIKKIKNRLNG